MKVICDFSVTSAPIRSRSWSPAELFAGGAQGAWYDPSDRATLFQDEAGIIPVAADGDPVALVLDKSGNNNHASVAVTAARPIFREVGTQRYLEFDGVDDFLATPNINMTALPAMTIAAGVYKADNALPGTLLGQFASAANAFGLRVSADGRSVFALSGTGEFNAVVSENALVAPYSAVVSGHGNIGVPTRTVRLNGQEKTTDNGSTATGFRNAPVFIGAFGTTGMPLGNYFFGHLYGLVFLAQDLWGDTLLRIERHLSDKTGVLLP